MMKRFIYAVFAALAICAALAAGAGESTKKGGGKMQVKVTSAAFDEGGMIPGKYTCDGQDVSPPLSWGSAPEGAKSIALISDDPDAPRGTWVHWVVFNLPPTLKGLPEGIPRKETLDDGGRQGVNDFGRFGYGGPCPPGGTHRYYFKIYILDTSLDLTGRVTKARLLEAMEGHILAEGRLMGRYKR
jgi:Raf kinase inhibitor-like YbhB/YbcL family protein